MSPANHDFRSLSAGVVLLCFDSCAASSRVYLSYLSVWTQDIVESVSIQKLKCYHRPGTY